MANSGKPPINITRVPPQRRKPSPLRAGDEPKAQFAGAIGAPLKIFADDAPAPPKEQAQITRERRVAQLVECYQAGDRQSALLESRRICDVYPDEPTSWNIRGACARAAGHAQEAEECFLTLEYLQPQFAGAPYNLGLVLEGQGRVSEAAEAYRKALGLDPNLVQAHNNLGILLTRLGQMGEAIEHLRKAADLQPRLPEIWNSLGNALKRAGRIAEARAAYERAVKVRPDFVGAIFNLGVLLQENAGMGDARAHFERVLEIDPGHELARSHLAFELARDCDWEAIASQREAILALGVETRGVPPWSLLAMEDAPERQLIRARSWAMRRFAQARRSRREDRFERPASRPERLRIGYFGADFHDHSTLHLMAGVLRAHDRGRFEVHALSYDTAPEDDHRRATREKVDHFHDVAGSSERDIVELALAARFDILIDCKGYSAGTRNEILRHRLAPVQIHYLAYPGTLAAPFIDYIVVDAVAVPGEHRAHIAEKLIRLPHTYQAADDARPIADEAGTRADHGLPDEAFVFCCFNATYKISQREFDIWMRLLGKVDDSVMWLFKSTPAVERNLRAQAQRRGIDPARIVFAEHTPNPQHLARQKHADLFLDTFAVNAHTTANDALWSGLPLVTSKGDQFAARVAASLLEAMEMSELVTTSDEEYEALALALARDPQLLAAIRQKLDEKRDTAPLFNTALYTRHFEAGLDAAYERWREGQAPADIDVKTGER
jgi:predicted O-linked N-acetylglucosamine transferase (SPINDLY family)